MATRSVLSGSGDTSFWHPFAEMAGVRSAEFVIERGEDVWVWDHEGRRLLDATASLWYANVGHGRREIAEAVTRQMGAIEAYSCFGDYATPPSLELSHRLASLSPMEDLVKRIPAPTRELMEELFRARFVTVKRLPKTALKS